MKQDPVTGHADEGWGRLADAFRANFERGFERGAACCVYLHGRPVVDLWGGTADAHTNRPWVEDTVAVVFSATKGATAICAHMLVERGLLDLDAPVVEYWPEFGAHGKEDILVRWLLTHQAGLPVVDLPLTLEEACAWDPVIRALEEQRPLWVPGAQHMYHAKTYGFLVGEVIRRITGKSVGRFFADEAAGPLGLSSWIGLPESVEPLVAHLELAPAPASAAILGTVLERFDVVRRPTGEEIRAWEQMTGDPNSPAVRSGTLGGSLPQLVTESGGANARIVRAAEFPGSNMVTDARSLARLYAATVADVDGVRLLEPATVEAMRVVQTSDSTPYGIPTELEPYAEELAPTLALGFMTPTRSMPLSGPGAFGHPGAGGSLGFADAEAGIGFGYIVNRMSSDGRDPRVPGLVAAVVDGLG
jgi:CubicO group peptidase (beta-lactamase class C family)